MKGQGNRERGNVVTIVLVGLIIILSTINAAAIAVAIMDKDQYMVPQDNPVAKVTTVNEYADIDSANELRKGDAIAIAAATADYYSNNLAKYPTGFSGGKLTGHDKPEPVRLGYYKQAAVATGAQKPLEQDGIRLVISAKCSSVGGATDNETTLTYLYVVQYGFQKPDKSFISNCYTP